MTATETLAAIALALVATAGVLLWQAARGRPWARSAGWHLVYLGFGLVLLVEVVTRLP